MIIVLQRLTHRQCNEAYGEFHIAHGAPSRSELSHQLLAQVPSPAEIVSLVQGPSQYVSGTHQVLLHQYTVPMKLTINKQQTIVQVKST